MSKRTLQANYFADDKDIYDFLSAARQKLTSAKLVEFARRRGLILSSEDDRDVLIDQLARLPFGWRELNALIEATDTAERVDRTTFRSISGAFTIDDLCAGTEMLAEQRSERRGEVFEQHRTKSGLIVVVRYSELDLSRTPLAQRTAREFSLDFEIAPGATCILVRHQDQSRAHEVLEELVQVLSTSKTGVDESRIELSGIRDATLRTEFFLRLIRAIPNFALEDVKSVKASRFLTQTVQEAPDDAQAVEAMFDRREDESSDDEGDDGVATDVAEFVAHVKDIAIRGQGLLKTPQYSHLTEHDFFVRSIAWTAMQEGPDGARVEFEAGFDNAELGTGFTYSVRGIYGRRSNGDLKKTRSAPDATERTKLHRLVEQAATASLRAIEDMLSATTVSSPLASDASMIGAGAP